MTGIERYRTLLALPHARALVAWSLLGRLPLGMTPLALLFLLRGEGYGYDAAGVGVAAYTVAVGIGAPIAGRRVDRLGPARVLWIRGLAYPATMAAVIALAQLDAGLGPIAVAAAAGGILMPPLPATVRIVWPRLAPGDLRTTAYALEAALQEIFFLGGPLLAAGLAALAPAAGVAGAGLACLVGTLATARLRPVRETEPSRLGGAGRLGALGSPGVRTIVIYAAAIGAGFGAVELAMPAFAEAHGSRELGGVALACFAGGSLAGGLVAGTRASGTGHRRFMLGSFAIALGLLCFQLAFSIPSLCVLAFIAGLPIAPTIAVVYTLIDRGARPGTAAEAFAWFGTAISVGIATGTAAGGLLVDEQGVRWAFGVGAALALVGALAGLVRRGTLAGGPLQHSVTGPDPARAPSSLPEERP
ncbi:MFS transporter [Gaiella sp.]|uniref:MFS transporter n=1 Tax=Gaiella sp. TaxID=2663207 RepID=UPI002E31B2B7|nr:MFS transporter [Gaiella sp.]HEX5583857.1 MFS transporter [Gaiella sp.]